MLTEPTWIDVLLRLFCATVGGIVVGYNREARSQAAGLRTTTLVCVAACLSMVLANLMMTISGKEPQSFVRLDVMRLPLGVLSGIGFIGAGAIIRRGDAVMGVVTAATLWFMTVVGLVFGAGQIGLGAGVTLGAIVMLSPLKRTDDVMRRSFRAALNVTAEATGLSEDELRGILEDHGQRIVTWAVTYTEGGAVFAARVELEWTGRRRDRARPPEFVAALMRRQAVREADWTPQALSG